MFKSAAICNKIRKRKKVANSRGKRNNKIEKNEIKIKEDPTEENEESCDFLLKSKLVKEHQQQHLRHQPQNQHQQQRQRQQEHQQELYQFQLSPRYFQYLRSNCAALPLLISTTHAANRVHTPSVTARDGNGGDTFVTKSGNGSGVTCIRDSDQIGEPAAPRTKIKSNTNTKTEAKAKAKTNAKAATKADSDSEAVTEPAADAEAEAEEEAAPEEAVAIAIAIDSLSCQAMPLSQGHYAKGAFAATKRAANKASRIGDEPKQRKYDTENNNCSSNKIQNNNHNNANNNSNNNNVNMNGSECGIGIGVNAGSGAGVGGVFQKKYTTNSQTFLSSTKTLLSISKSAPKATFASLASTPSRLLKFNSLNSSHANNTNKSPKGNISSHFAMNNGNKNGSKKAESSLQFSYYVGESLARCGHLQEAFDIYALIASKQLDGSVPLDRLNVLATCLIEYVRQLQNRLLPADGTSSNSAATRRKASCCDDLDCGHVASKRKCTKGAGQAARPIAVSTAPTIADAIDVDPTSLANDVAAVGASDADSSTLVAMANDFDHDPLLCPLCNDILRCPVTTNCGHTFCRQCCDVITACNICHIKFPRIGFDSDFAANLATPATAIATPPIFNFPMTLSSHNQTLENIQSLRQLNNVTNISNASTTLAITTTPTQSPTTPTQSPTTPPITPHVLNRTSASRESQRAVTTSTVSLTTATATTTMASTPTAGCSIGSAGGAANSLRFMTDVTVRRLVEKWWGPDLQAQKISETAASYMHLNLLDDALKFCNASLEKSPTNFKSLLLRAEVLRKLNHSQSSLADVDNALRSRYTSAKGHYLRALVLTELGRVDEALYDICLAISLDKATNLSSSEIFQHDLAKVLQKLLAQAPKTKTVTSAPGIVPHRNHLSAWPYKMLAEQRLCRKQNTLMSSANGENLGSLGRNLSSFGKAILIDDADIMAGDDDFLIDATEDGDDDDDDDDDGYELTNSTAAAAAAVAAYTELAQADCELMALRRPSYRKHFRRKWVTKETELVPNIAVDARCCALFRGVLERTQNELQRLKKLEAASGDQHKEQLQVPQSLIDASDFDCVLCCRTFWKPVVTPCGHTYCWVCLDRCMDYTSSCPLCMSPLVESTVNMYQGLSSPVPFVLAKRPVTKFLEAAMKRFIPESYEKRFRQEMDMEPSVPVFICTTAFPCVPCPLFVYEPRYRLMVRRAVESGEKQFGIVQPHSGKSRYFDVGTILDIRDCVLLGDGCSILSTIGCKRFRILARSEKDGYETAKVEYIYDETIADENIQFVSNMHATVLAKAVDWFESLSVDLKQEIFQSFGEMPLVEDNWERIADGPAWAWWIIALLPLKQQLKVGILATTSLEKRLRAIEKTLDYLSGSFQRTQQSCDVVVVQQQQQQQEQHDQQQQCAVDLTHPTPTSVPAAHDECCQRTTEPNVASSMHSAATTTAATNSTTEHHAQLLL